METLLIYMIFLCLKMLWKYLKNITLIGVDCLMVEKNCKRNVFQVLGADLKTPTEFIICWTDKYGGTQQALRIAKSFSIPVFNLFKK